MSRYLPLILTGLSFAPAALPAEKKSRGANDDVKQAVEFERRKAAAAARQAKREAKRPSVHSTSNAERSVEEQPAGRKVRDPGEPQSRTEGSDRQTDSDARK